MELTNEQEDLILSREEIYNLDNDDREEPFRVYYSEHKQEIIDEFRGFMRKDELEHELPENDFDLEEEYYDQLIEIAKEWYDESLDLIETQNSLRRY